MPKTAEFGSKTVGQFKEIDSLPMVEVPMANLAEAGVKYILEPSVSHVCP